MYFPKWRLDGRDFLGGFSRRNRHSLPPYTVRKVHCIQPGRPRGPCDLVHPQKEKKPEHCRERTDYLSWYTRTVGPNAQFSTEHTGFSRIGRGPYATGRESRASRRAASTVDIVHPLYLYTERDSVVSSWPRTAIDTYTVDLRAESTCAARRAVFCAEGGEFNERPISEGRFAARADVLAVHVRDFMHYFDPNLID